MIKRLKGQLAMFIIISLAILLAFSFVIYLINQSTKKINVKTEKIQKIKPDVKPVVSFVNQCLELASKNALLKLGKQGGYLYKSEGGLKKDFDIIYEGILFLRHEGIDLPYAIMQPSHPLIPAYPWNEFPKHPLTNELTFSGFFGIPILPPLHKNSGAMSIESQLEEYVLNNAIDCAKFDSFAKEGYNIKAGIARVNVTIAQNDVAFLLEYPLTIEKSNEIIEVSDFFSKIDVRLQRIYFFVNQIINSDVNDISFDISSQNNEPFISVNVKRDVPVKNIPSQDDVIVVRDSKSKISGRDFEFYFARHNRAPALHYLDNLIITTHDDGSMILLGDNVYRKDVVFPQNPDSLKAYDPDEDDLTFNYQSLYGDLTDDDSTASFFSSESVRVKASDGMLEDYQDVLVEVT